MKRTQKISIAFLAMFSMVSATNPAFSQRKKSKDMDAPAQTKAAAAPTPAFIKLPSGIQYAILRDEPGTQMAKPGDYVEMHLVAACGDSVLFDSRKMNHGEPVAFQIQKPQFQGDPVEGFSMLTPGDSAIVLAPVDSIKKMGGQLPPFMKEGMMVKYNVVMVSIKTAEQKKADEEAKAGKQIAIDDSLLKDHFTKNKIEATKTPSGMYIKVHKQGTGPTPVEGENVTVNYTGKTIDGKTFDSNVDTNFHHVSPFSFAIGKGNVIKGWDLGVAMMKKGEKATLYIPSPLAYGEHSPSPLIPANGILIFDVEVTDIKSAEAPKQYEPPTPAPGASKKDAAKKEAKPKKAAK